jgi:DNA-binding MarR family transcriptional regulator
MQELRLSYLVGRADRILRTHIDELLSELDLSVSELTALSVLTARPGLSNARLARRSLVTPQAMHKVTRSLEDRGLVTRAPSEAGGRSMDTFITDAGSDLLSKADSLLDQVEEDFLDGLSPADRKELTRMLLAVCNLD